MQNIFFGPVSVFPVLCIIIIALVSVTVLSKDERFTLQPVKYEAFDGLKGYLTIFVVVCHSSTWFYYLRTGNWFESPSHLFSQTGKASISLFFMITAFLFCNKLIYGKTNWLNFYVSRLVRLFPLYLVAMISLFSIVAYLSNYTLNSNDTWLSLASQIRKWLMFTIKNDPDINGIKNTWIIICKVTWTLRYEWVFYLILPILSLVLSKNKPDYLSILLSTLIVILILLFWEFDLTLFTPFIGGVIASLLSKSVKISRLASHWAGSVITLSLVLLLVFLFNFTSISAYEILPYILITSIFILVVCGNRLWGILSGDLVRKLGQLSYGIYLFHGIIYFIFFKFVLGFDKAANLSSLQHWICIFLITPILISISYVLHIYVELPALQFTPLLYKKINDGISTFKQKIVIGIKF